jgi:hypothetical protein
LHPKCGGSGCLHIARPVDLSGKVLILDETTASLYITFDGTLPSWSTKILIGLLLFAFILMQKAILFVFSLNKRYA